MKKLNISISLECETREGADTIFYTVLSILPVTAKVSGVYSDREELGVTE